MVVLSKSGYGLRRHESGRLRQRDSQKRRNVLTKKGEQYIRDSGTAAKEVLKIRTDCNCRCLVFKNTPAFQTIWLIKTAVSLLSGRSAAWLARLPWEQEVGGSNPLAPTI